MRYLAKEAGSTREVAFGKGAFLQSFSAFHSGSEVHMASREGGDAVLFRRGAGQVTVLGVSSRGLAFPS